MRSDADQHETATLQRRSGHRATGLISASAGNPWFIHAGGHRYRQTVRPAIPGVRVDTSTLRIVIISTAGSNNRSAPIWEIGDVVNVLEEWENITR